MPASKIAPTSPAAGSGGKRIRADLTPDAWCSSTDLGQDQHDPPPRARCPRRPAGRQGAAGPLAHADFSGSTAARPHHRTLCHRRADQWHQLSRLHRAVPDPDPQRRRCRHLIMDNLGSHKGKTVRRLIRSVGAKLFFLPRYSPDLNPIEQVFAKLKTLLRKTDPRTIETTWRGIG